MMVMGNQSSLGPLPARRTGIQWALCPLTIRSHSSGPHGMRSAGGSGRGTTVPLASRTAASMAEYSNFGPVWPTKSKASIGEANSAVTVSPVPSSLNVTVLTLRLPRVA